MLADEADIRGIRKIRGMWQIGESVKTAAGNYLFLFYECDYLSFQFIWGNRAVYEKKAMEFGES